MTGEGGEKTVKRRLILCLITLMLLSPLATANAEAPTREKKSTFVLPVSLLLIEDEAFEGTAVGMLVIQDGLQRIGDRAFSDMPNLRAVYIPPSTTFIGKRAFPNNKDLAIYGVKGSYAEKWAGRHQIVFVAGELHELFSAGETMLVSYKTSMEGMFRAPEPNVDFRMTKRTADQEKSMRPQDRPELYPIVYRFP